MLPRVLLNDDDARWLELLVSDLQLFGWGVTHAADAPRTRGRGTAGGARVGITRARTGA